MGIQFGERKYLDIYFLLLFSAESSLAQCHFTNYKYNTCTHAKDAGVICKGRYSSAILFDSHTTIKLPLLPKCSVTGSPEVRRIVPEYQINIREGEASEQNFHHNFVFPI